VLVNQVAVMGCQITLDTVEAPAALARRPSEPLREATDQMLQLSQHGCPLAIVKARDPGATKVAVALGAALV
jgi:hypothetical protein